MDVIIALIFISLTLVIAGLVFFFTRLFEGDFEHGERLSLLPLADDDGMSASPSESEGDNVDEMGCNPESDSLEFSEEDPEMGADASVRPQTDPESTAGPQDRF